MSEASGLLNDLSEAALWRLEEVCNRFEQSWQAGQQPRPEDFLGAAEGAERLAVLRELLRLDLFYRHRAGEAPSAKDYATRFPDATALLNDLFPGSPEDAEDTNPDAERTGPDLGAMNSGQGDAPAGEAAVPPASRFRVRRFHAAGGLGEVFVAEDVELHREVALKEIKRAHAGHEDSRARFVLEAEITGNLEHPGIVPVYGLGTYPDGRPFYAMRFIRGDTLLAAIQGFHGQTPVRFDSLEFRQLLGRLVAVCQAIAYAHNRGVLHRDIKPGNIMLGKFGETLVVDWGLAKVVGRPDAAEAGPGAESLLRPMGGERAQATVGLVGTPAFMSPEQAAGKVQELSPATDVYSLGATLYALLTNRAPFKGPVVDVVRQVERGEWLPPRQVNSSVPAALDAICCKAMALRPQERYASALALAEDVEHFLADEPVAAYPEPAGARLRRWMRKRPRRVTAAVVLLLTAVVGLTAGTVLLEQSKRETEATLAMVEGQANFFMKEVSEELLMNEPGMQQLRQRILMKVLDDYARFLKKRPRDPHTRQQMAEAKRQLGELSLENGRMLEARALADQAVEAYEGLLREAPADRGLRFGLARARRLLADAQVQSGDLGEGKKAVDRAIELLEELKSEEPGNGGYLLALARSYDLRAAAEGQQGHIEPGLADNKRVLKILVEGAPSLGTGRGMDQSGQSGGSVLPPFRLKEWVPKTGGYSGLDMPWPASLLLGHACTDQGILLSMSGRNGEAARVLGLAILVHRRLLDGNARAGQFRHGLALALLHSGRVQVRLGLPGRAEPALREALGLMQHLVQDDPLVKEYRATRLLAAGYLGEALFRQGRTAAAAELLRETEKKGEEVLAGSRKTLGLRGQHVWLLHVLGCLEGESGNLDRGRAVCRKAHEKLEQALRETPGDRSLRSDWLANREALARWRFLKGHLTRVGWIAFQQRILQESNDLAGLVGQGPLEPRFQGELAGSAAVLAGLLLEAGRPTEALACVDGVLPALEQAVRTEQERVKRVAKEQQEGEPFIRGNTGSLQVVLRKMPIVPNNSLHRDWARLLACQGAALSRVGRGREAVATVRQAIGITRSRLSGGGPLRSPRSLSSLWADIAEWLGWVEPCYLYDLSCHLALASTLPGENGRPNPADQAILALRSCVASGFDNPQKLRTDPALEPLRKRDDFQKLVRDLETWRAGAGDAPQNR